MAVTWTPPLDLGAGDAVPHALLGYEIEVDPTPYTLRPTPYTLHPTPYTPHPTPYTLHPTPCTLHPAPYTLHPTPYTQHPTPYTLHPGGCVRAGGRAGGGGGAGRWRRGDQRGGINFRRESFDLKP